MAQNPKRRGIMTEVEVLRRLVKAGYNVSIPFHDSCPYDYVVDFSGELARVQVKTGRIVKGTVEFDTSLLVVNRTSSEKRDYHGLIDFFVVYSPDLDRLYKVPIGEVGTAEFRLRFEEPEQDSSLINWAEDYRLDLEP